MEILVSVIIPVYNVEKYLKRCVSSILNQKINSLEIILVDDGSTDTSGTICDQLSSSNSKIKVIHQHNKGLSGARNTGLDKAIGRYICFVDSDDYIEGDLLLDVIPLLEKNNLDCLGFGGKILKGKTTTFWGNKKACKYENGEDYVKKYIPISSVCLYIYRRAFLRNNNIKFIEGIFYEDMMFIIDVLLSKPRFEIITNMYYIYDKREGSITTSQVKLKNYEDINFIVQSYLEKLNVLEDNLAIKNVLKTYLLISEEIYHKLSAKDKQQSKELRKNVLNKLKKLDFYNNKIIFVECRFIDWIYMLRNIRRYLLRKT